MRKGAAALVLAAAAGAAAWRRRQGRRGAHVDLYFADGSMISLDEASEEASRLLPLAHELVTAFR